MHQRCCTSRKCNRRQT